jgi:methylated-DNA-[protein]-cysteine S-methyltransferase
MNKKILSIGSAVIAPFGEIWVAVSEDGLFALDFPSTKVHFTQNLSQKNLVELEEDQKKAQPILDQISEYALGVRRQFDIAIDWDAMGAFQKKALRATFAIPIGQVVTYKEIAAAIGSPNGARAVGRAEATNPIPLVIPCHRVLGSDHQLHGYGAGNGLETKRWLLDLEGVK